MYYLEQRLDKRKRHCFVPSTSERIIKRSVFISTASRAARLSLSLTLITWNADKKAEVSELYSSKRSSQKYSAKLWQAKLMTKYVDDRFCRALLSAKHRAYLATPFPSMHCSSH